MKLFISWSGEKSKQVAIAFKDWLPSMIQAVEPFVSSEDVEKGTRGINRVFKELQNSNFGLLCFTKENPENPWILFEAGALSKMVDQENYVAPFLFGIDHDEIPAPIKEFQYTCFEREDIWKLVRVINKACGEEGRPEENLKKTFEYLYPVLERDLNMIKDRLDEIISADTFTPEACGKIIAVALNTKKGRDSHLSDLIADINGYIEGASNTPVIYNGMGQWFRLNNRMVDGCAPVFMGAKECLQEGLSLEEREKGAEKIRVLNYAGTSFLASKKVATSYGLDWQEWFQNALRGGISIDMILTAPGTAAAEDAAKYKMFPPQGGEVPADIIIRENFKILSAIEGNVNTLKEMNPDIKLIARKTEIALPYALLETIFDDSTKNHIKVDLYSPLTGDDNERPSFMIYKNDQSALYDHFSKVITNVSNSNATKVIVHTYQGE